MDKNYIKISELNNYIKQIIDTNPYLNKVYLKGEISNFKNHTRGHLYFTLKDDTSRISAVMFASCASNLTFKPEDGMNVLVEGRIGVYPATGAYQVYVTSMSVDGLGALYIEYEKLKKKLSTLGLFDEAHKKKIPRFPDKIGVVTASTGAAIRDIMSTIKRRYPVCEVILFPCLVQGALAKDDIVRQIKRADEYGVDTIIVGRGGGSIEDLWAFNEEIVARAIYDCKTPIISAVGHEIDFTIADFVADLRAPTPTGAAEMAVPTIMDIMMLLNNYKIRLNKNIKNMVNTKYIKLRSLKNSFILKNPMSIYEIKSQKLDTLIDKTNMNIQNIINKKSEYLKTLKSSFIFKNPEMLFDKKNNEFKLLLNTLKLVNPIAILDKGYSLVEVNKKIIKDSKSIKVDDELDIRLSKGSLKAKVTSVKS